AGEIVRDSCGNSAFTREITSRMFAPAVRRTITITVRSPSNQPATRRFSTSSVTVAISPSRTAELSPGAFVAVVVAACTVLVAAGVARPNDGEPVPGGAAAAGAPLELTIVVFGSNAGATVSPGLD